MSSVARYSPVYAESPQTFTGNPVVLHPTVVAPEDENPQPTERQYVSDLVDPTAAAGAAAEEVLPVSLNNTDLRQVISNRLLQMIADDEISSGSPNTETLEMVPESEQGVELLITDQSTGRVWD